MIKIYSTFSKDTIIDTKTKYLIVKIYGPAFFIEKIFKKYGIKYKLHTGGIIKIEIKITKKGERGKIISNIKENKKIRNIKNNDIIIISTVGKEWILDDKNIPPQTKIFLDIQGYIRTKEKSDKLFKDNFWNKIYCIKGTEKEISQLPKNIIANQKKKCLIITKGDRGSVVYFKNRQHILRAKEMELKNTIGAGDTFFAAIIVHFIKIDNIVTSAKFATKDVEKFLNRNLCNKYNKNKVKTLTKKI
ncbi:PfkB family carbohydrate kinase [Patescibacteria group bacterium]